MEAHQRAMSDATHGLIVQLMAKAVEVATKKEQLATANDQFTQAQATAREQLVQAQASIVNMEVRLESKEDTIRILQNISMVSTSTQSSTHSSPESKK